MSTNVKSATAPVLRGKPPAEVAEKKKLKVLLFGKPGVGKTTAALQFPFPYVIDCEKGAENHQYVEAMKASGAAYLYEPTYEGIVEQVRALRSQDHPFQTLVIDPITVPYDLLLDDEVSRGVSTDYGRHKAEPDRKIKRLLNLILTLDMNVVLISRAKDSWVRGKDASGKDVAAQDGITFDFFGRSDYIFDLVIEVSRIGKVLKGRVRKSRIEAFPLEDRFDFSYDEIANRYGRDVLERKSVTVELATKEDIALLEAALSTRVDRDEIVGKLLKHCAVDDINDLPRAVVAGSLKKLGVNKENA
jgi:hypothetical protein